MIRVVSKKLAKGLFIITVSATLYQINWGAGRPANDDNS